MDRMGILPQRPLARQLPTERMDEVSFLRAPSVKVMWERQLVIKLHGRQHTSGGPRMVRSYIFENYPASSLGIHVPHLYRAVCPFWETVRHRMRPAHKLFPNLTAQRFTARLRDVAHRMGREKAERPWTRGLG